MMNNESKKLKLANTLFLNPHGFCDNRSNCSDIA